MQEMYDLMQKLPAYIHEGVRDFDNILRGYNHICWFQKDCRAIGG